MVIPDLFASLLTVSLPVFCRKYVSAFIRKLRILSFIDVLCIMYFYILHWQRTNIVMIVNGDIVDSDQCTSSV